MNRTTNVHKDNVNKNLEEGAQIIWIDTNSVQLSATPYNDARCIDISTTCSSELVKEGWIINSNKKLNPEKPPKYIWYKVKTRYYNITFRTINAFYYKYNRGIFMHDLCGVPPLAQEVIMCNRSCSDLFPTLRYYGFMQIGASALLNICKYNVESGDKPIQYQSETVLVDAFDLPKQQSITEYFMYAHTLRLLSYIETTHAGDLYNHLDKLKNSSELWDEIEAYILDYKEEGESFDFLPENYLNKLKVRRNNEQRQIKETGSDVATLSAKLLKIIAYHKRYHDLHETWIFDGFEANPMLSLNPDCIIYKQQILAQTARGQFNRNNKNQ